MCIYYAFHTHIRIASRDIFGHGMISDDEVKFAFYLVLKHFINFHWLFHSSPVPERDSV